MSIPRSEATPERILQRLDWHVIRRLDGLLQGDYRTLFYGFGTVAWYAAMLGSTWFLAHVVASTFLFLAISGCLVLGLLLAELLVPEELLELIVGATGQLADGMPPTGEPA